MLKGSYWGTKKALEDARRLIPSKTFNLAICGVGKTEVVFGPIEQALALGQKVMLVTPRKDVVLELLPRLQQAFPKVKMIALHGKSTEKWEEASLTLSTTHQALRFYQKFDLVIIDEVDAFRYHNNLILYFAVERARKPQGNLIYLSATPPAYLRKIQQIRIPARYHRKPLAIPKIIIEKNLTKSLKNHEPLQVLREIIQYWKDHQRQGFVFVPFIERADVLVNQLMNYVSVVGTHSRDPMREEKVMKFRRGRPSSL